MLSVWVSEDDGTDIEQEPGRVVDGAVFGDRVENFQDHRIDIGERVQQ